MRDALDAFVGSVPRVSDYVDGHGAMLAAVGPALDAFRAGEPPPGFPAGGMTRHAALPAAVARAFATARAETTAGMATISGFRP